MVEEMAILSQTIYQYRTLHPEDVCTDLEQKGYECRWYHHDAYGTQVAVVSSHDYQYHAVVFCGTDDWKTTLTDANVRTLPFYDTQVHAGFLQAVEVVYDNVRSYLDAARIEFPDYRLYTTGHSLGAAESLILAVNLTLNYQHEAQQANQHHHKSWNPFKKHHHHTPPPLTNINFGCPQTGNDAWTYFVHHAPQLNSLSLWRLVLGWDLVPRLPDFFHHAGHTVQMHKNGTFHPYGDVLAYYLHHGSVDLGYAGVPKTWPYKPYGWMPSALYSHHVGKYRDLVAEWKQRGVWVDHFEPLEDYQDDDRMPNIDDDFWVNPPDDDGGGDGDDFEGAGLATQRDAMLQEQ